MWSRFNSSKNVIVTTPQWKWKGKKKNISKPSIYGNWWHTDTVWIQNIQRVLHAGQIVALQTHHRSSAMENPVFDNGPVVTQPLQIPLCLDGALGAVGHVVDQNADEGGHHFSGHPRTAPGTLQRRGTEGTSDFQSFMWGLHIIITELITSI